MDRRNFLRYGAAAGALFGAARINPDFFFRSAHAQDARPLVFLSAENITGNWDPTAHTTLSQTNIEGFVMGYLTRAPMRPEKPDEVVYELATEITELDAHRLQIKLREGVTFHDGKPFDADDVVFSFERIGSAASDLRAVVSEVREVRVPAVARAVAGDRHEAGDRRRAGDTGAPRDRRSA